MFIAMGYLCKTILIHLKSKKVFHKKVEVIKIILNNFVKSYYIRFRQIVSDRYRKQVKQQKKKQEYLRQISIGLKALKYGVDVMLDRIGATRKVRRQYWRDLIANRPVREEILNSLIQLYDVNRKR